MPTRQDFTSIGVRDLVGARQYYTAVLGFTPSDLERPGAVVFENAEGAIFAIRTIQPGTSADAALGAGVSLWFAVDDADAAHARVVTAGAQVLSPPQPGPFGRMFVVRDPDGYLLTFHEAPGEAS